MRGTEKGRRRGTTVREPHGRRGAMVAQRRALVVSECRARSILDSRDAVRTGGLLRSTAFCRDRPLPRPLSPHAGEGSVGCRIARTLC